VDGNNRSTVTSVAAEKYCLQWSGGSTMKTLLALSSLFLLCEHQGAFAQQDMNVPAKFSTTMQQHGNAISDKDANCIHDLSSGGLEALTVEIPLNQLSKLTQTPILEAAGVTRSAKDAQIYRAISPSVVMVVNKEGLGTGSLLNATGDILTNWHVVKGYSYVAIVFKPAIEGKEPTRDETKLGRVVRYDEIADLALVKASDVPVGRIPIRLGDESEIAVGMDVHTIGHPIGEAWTYTTGIISQYRQAYEWQAKDDPIKHRADIIQTQTPINPGNSGGPLLSDSGNLVGVNSFGAGGEGLNYAVSADEVRRFLARTDNRIAQQAPNRDQGCKLTELSRFRSQENDAAVIAYDMFCTGNDNAEYVVPDDKTKAIFLRLDRNGDGKADAIIFDFKRRGKWDLSFWDEKFQGYWTLVGYHDDGSLKPTRFESYAEFQRRVATR
jgi:S1-C subfamily serine protease